MRLLHRAIRSTPVVLALLVSGCDLPADTTTIVEVKCGGSGFDENGHCNKPERLGAVLEFRVNAAGQKVQITIIKNDDNWMVKDIFLDSCTVMILPIGSVPDRVMRHSGWREGNMLIFLGARKHQASVVFKDGSFAMV